MTPSTADDQPRDLTDEEKLQVLPALTSLNRSFVRAWRLKMLVVHTDGDRRWLEAIASGMHLPDEPPSESDLVPLSTEEEVRLAGAMIARLNLFREAYRRGMFVADDDEQREVLEKLASGLSDA
jgi:hypothetical protein